MSRRVIVVGGGLAGLAAASELACRGYAVTILESRPRLGGRASSFVDSKTGELIDQCQHVAMGCCTNFLRFCERTGIRGSFQTFKSLNFVGPRGESSEFKAGPWPAPLHLAGALGGLKYLNGKDRRAIRKGLFALAKSNDEREESFAEWLRGQGQTEQAVRLFWEVVLVSALSESLERISLKYARKVFVDSFLRNRQGWRVLVPTVPLHRLYDEQIAKWLRQRGTSIRTLEGVESLEENGEQVQSAVLRGGNRVEGEDFVLAVPWNRVTKLLPERLRRGYEGVAQLESAPITSVHLWWDRPVIGQQHAVLVGRMSQWVFSRPLQEGGKQGHYYQVVISASHELLKKPANELTDMVVKELTEIWPEVRNGVLIHSRVVTEHKAVFSPLPDCDRMRPSQQTAIGNLQLAGDYTQTGWPSTMEGAVRSGYLAAENILRRDGNDQQLLAGDLETGWLPRTLFGLTSAHGKK